MSAEPLGPSLRPMTELAVTAHVQRMLAQALTESLYARVERVARNTFVVPSKSRGGVAHCVYVPPRGAPSCTCEAGDHLPYCRHRAAVQIHLWLEEGYEIAVNAKGQVVRIREELAAPLAYDPHNYEALVPDQPPLSAYEGDAPEEEEDAEAE